MVNRLSTFQKNVDLAISFWDLNDKRAFGGPTSLLGYKIIFAEVLQTMGHASEIDVAFCFQVEFGGHKLRCTFSTHFRIVLSTGSDQPDDIKSTS